MLTHFFKTAEQTDMQTLPEARGGAWSHVISPTEAECAKLIADYGLDEAILEDSKDVFEVPRFEQEGSVSYFFTRYPYDVPDIDIDTAPILFILSEQSLITVVHEVVPFLEPFLEGKRAINTTQNTKLFLDFLSELVVTYERKLTHTRKLVYRDMGRVRSIRGRDIQRLVFLEQELNETIAALVPTNAWLGQLNRGNYIHMFTDDREMLEDVLIASSQLVESAKSILKTIQNVRSASEAILTQNLNSTIRTLTVFTIILTIPTLIASIFGMNVSIPYEHAPNAFWFVLLFIFMVVGITMYFFHKNRWI